MFYRPPTENPAQRLRRARPVIAMASVAFAIGAIVGANHTASSAHELAGRFVEAWTKGDYATMYSDIDASSRRTTCRRERPRAAPSPRCAFSATAIKAAVRKPPDSRGSIFTSSTG